MLAYAAGRPRAAAPKSSPNTLLFIIAAHVALVAVVMSIKMDLPGRISRRPPIEIIMIPKQVEPQPPQARVVPKVRSVPQPKISNLDPVVRLPSPSPVVVDPGPLFPNPGPIVSPGTGPVVNPVPIPNIERTPPRLLTAAGDLRPPYPEAKRLSGEEALLTLKLTINDRGRVVAVEPVGAADKAFLDSARRHLLARWRYRPASEDGRAIASTLTIKLRFQLES